MPQAHANAAYDFSLFEPKEERLEKEEAEKKSAGQAVRPKASVHPAAVVKGCAAGLLVVVTLVAIMLCNVQLNNLGDKISKSKSSLNAAQSEQVRLNMELESRMSLQNVEKYATEKAGMQKAGPYQITYVHMTSEDKVDVAPRRANIFTKLFNFILAYL